MNRHLAWFLQGSIVLLGLGALTLLLWEPHLEGRNAHATFGQIYFHDPFLAFVYVGSVPFFLGLYLAFKLIGDLRGIGVPTQATVGNLHNIRSCAVTDIGFVLAGMFFIHMHGDPDERPAGFFMGLLIALPAGATAMIATWLAGKIQSILASSAVSQSPRSV